MRHWLDRGNMRNGEGREPVRRGWSRMLRSFWHSGVVLTSLLAATLSAGALYQAGCTVWDRHRLPPPGKLVPVEGLSLHMLESGKRRAEGDPVVVLETGLGAMSSAWGWIQPEVAGFAKVVAYDREGLGWSEAESGPPSAVRHARRVHAMLEAAGLKPPYLLVGHSMGGLLIRVFHDLYPDEVCGMVLIDASHPDQHLRSHAMRDHMNAGFRLLNTLPLLAGVGYVRISDYLLSQAQGLPPLQFDQARSFLCSYSHLKSANLEGRNWDSLCSEVRATGGLGDKPLTVISAGQGARPGADELQNELAALSSRGRRVIVNDADHVTLVTHREHAHRVAEEIRRLLPMTGSYGRQRRPAPELAVTANPLL